MELISTYRAPKPGITEKVQDAFWQLWTGRDTLGARLAGLAVVTALGGALTIAAWAVMAAAGAR